MLLHVHQKISIRKMDHNLQVTCLHINFASKYLKDKICRDVITGKKNIALAISEPTAGSDVANIMTTATK